MALIGGAFLRVFATVLRFIQLLASILVLGIFSYFLAVLADHDKHIYARWKAVEGMSGAAVLYGFFCVFLTLFLGGIAFFAFFAVVLDICFVGCYIVIAWFTRHVTNNKCTGTVNTVLGTGSANTKDVGSTWSPKLGRACELEKAVFAVAIVNIGLFIVTAVFQVLLVRHHRKEKRYGPGPSNNYTSGSGRRFWHRKGRNNRDAELATGGLAAEKHEHIRPSHDTAMTGNTLQNNQAGYQHPTGTAVNY